MPDRHAHKYQPHSYQEHCERIQAHFIWREGSSLFHTSRSYLKMPPKASSSKASPPKLKFQPKAGARRSKEERDADEKAENEKANARMLASSAQPDRGSRGRGRGRGRGFSGGLSGWRNAIQGSASASGFLGGPSIGESTPISGGSTGGQLSTIEGQQLPSYIEAGLKAQGWKVKSKPPAIKTEDGRVLIDLVSDEEEVTNDRELGWDINKIHEIPDGLEKPIRIQRREHVDRNVGVNTDASWTTTGAEFQEKVEQTITEKTKVEGMDTLSSGQKWSGVWSDSEDEEKPVSLVKKEPVHVDVDATTTVDSSAATQAAGPSKQPRTKKKTGPGYYPHLIEEPSLQTDEDKAEWTRRKENMKAIADELGLDNTKVSETLPSSANTLSNEADPDQKADRREGLAYWFQLPPRMPKLVPAPGYEDVAGQSSPVTESKLGDLGFQTPKANPAAQDEVSNIQSIEEEDGDEAGPATQLTEHQELLKKCMDSDEKEAFEGEAGDLTVYEDGTAIMNWGGIEHVVSKGMLSSMLQEVTLVDAEASAVHSMGQLAGTFLVKAEFQQLFEEEDAANANSSDEDDEEDD